MTPARCVRSTRGRFVAACLLLVTGLGLGTASGPVSALEAAAPDDRPARGLLVQLKSRPALDGRGEALRLAHVLAAAGIAPRRWRAVGRAAQHLDFERPLGPAEAAGLAQRLRAQPEVEWVVTNSRERRLDADSQQPPNDPLYGAQWWLHSVAGSNANALADRRRGVPGFETGWRTHDGEDGSPVVVAVLDTGITVHPDLRGSNVLKGYDFVSQLEYANDGDGRDDDPSDPGDWVSASDRAGRPDLFGGCPVEDSNWHGTVIAGMVAASTDNALGVAGARWGGRVLPVRVGGKCGAELADILDGMRWAAGLAVAGAPRNPHPARIVNISFGASAACNPAYQDTIDELARLGVVVIAAAGNGHGAITRPANCARVIGVAALNRDGFKASYSNFGPGLALATVGGDAADGAWTGLLGDGGLLGLDNAGSREPGAPVYRAVSGTSFAAPLVAATVGLMLAVNARLSAAQIAAGLAASARPHVVSSRIGACSALNPGRCICSAATCGVGILDVAQALAYAQSPSTYQAPNWPLVDLDSAAEVVRATAVGPDRAAEAGVPDSVTTAAPTPAGGGGALDTGWLLGLAAAVAGLAARRRAAGADGRLSAVRRPTRRA